ncbi:MAG: YhbY family RNA-binding protein [Zestosphaera sp.]
MHEKKVRKLGRVLSEPARVRIGKGGLNEGVLNEIRRYLEREGTVKVKVLRTAAGRVDVERLALEVSTELGAELRDVRGHTFTIARRKQPA